MRFFVLKYSPDFELVTAATDYYEIEPNLGDAPYCEVCGKPIGMLAWLPPYRVELELWHKAFGDIVFGPGPDLLVSERFKRCYESAGLTGFLGFEPVEVVRVKKRKRFVGDPPPYYHVTACRSRAAIDLAKSGFETDGDPPVCPVYRIDGILLRGRAVIIEQSTWSGEDVFIARGLPGTIITTERFKEAARLTGLPTRSSFRRRSIVLIFTSPKTWVITSRKTRLTKGRSPNGGRI